MPTKKLMSGFDTLENMDANRDNSGGFSKLGALKTIRILSTPPDNYASVRFLSEDFAMIRVHRWVSIGDKKKNVLCKTTFDRAAHCPICESGHRYSSQGICLVANLDKADNQLYEEIEDASPEHYDDYAKVMKTEDIVKMKKKSSNGEEQEVLVLNNVPQIRILQMGANFWRNIAFFKEKYGSICDRPYTIFRQGEKLETKYNVVPSDKDPDFKSAELLQANLEPGLDFCMSIEAYVDLLGSKKYYENFVEEDQKDSSIQENKEPSLEDMLKGN